MTKLQTTITHLSLGIIAAIALSSCSSSSITIQPNAVNAGVKFVNTECDLRNSGIAGSTLYSFRGKSAKISEKAFALVKHMGSTEFVMECYDDELNLKWSQPIELGGSKRWSHLLYDANVLSLLYNEAENDVVRYKVRRYDASNGKFLKEETVCEFTNHKNEDAMVWLAFSPDSSHILLALPELPIADAKKVQKDKAQAFVLDRSLKVLSTGSFEFRTDIYSALPNNEGRVNPYFPSSTAFMLSMKPGLKLRDDKDHPAAIDNSGNMYLPEVGQDGNLLILGIHRYSMVDFKKTSLSKRIKLTDDYLYSTDAHDGVLNVMPDGSLRLVVGLHSEKEVRGLVSINADFATNSITHAESLALTKSFMTEKCGDDMKLEGACLRESQVLQDGTMIVFFEKQSYMKLTSTSNGSVQNVEYYPVSGDLLIVALNKEGKVAWANIKRTQAKASTYHGVSFMRMNNGKKTRVWGGNGGIMGCYGIGIDNQSGKMNSFTFPFSIEPDYRNFQFDRELTLQLSADKVICCGEDGKGFYIFRMDFSTLDK